MIDLTRVSKTRCGYPVVATHYFPNNTEGTQVIALYEYNGQVEFEYFHDDGSYWTKELPQGLDLIEDSKEATKDRETLKQIVNQDFGNQYVNQHMQEALESIIGTASYVLQDTYKEL